MEINLKSYDLYREILDYATRKRLIIIKNKG